MKGDETRRRARALVALTTSAVAQQKLPDLSGYWGPGRGAKPDSQIVKQLPPNTVVLAETIGGMKAVLRSLRHRPG